MISDARALRRVASIVETVCEQLATHLKYEFKIARKAVMSFAAAVICRLRPWSFRLIFDLDPKEILVSGSRA